MPHFISKYIHINYANVSLNTQKKYAEEIKKFLNYLYTEKLSEELKAKGIGALTLKDGVRYLNSLASKVVSSSIKYETYNYSHKVLANLYLWLSENNLIDAEIKSSTKSVLVNDESYEIKTSPFTRLDLGLIIVHNKRRTKDNTRLHDFGIHRKDLINLFLKVAEVEEPDIVIGIVIQIFGGVRIGEVMNLRHTDINLRDEGSHMPITFEVKDRWSEIFEGKKNIHLEQIKTEREQIVINSSFIRDYFFKYLKIRKNRVDIDSNALIINSKTKEAMRSQAYRYKFEKVKKKFLEIVKYTSEEDYVYLTSKPWSTHIGRGIYTNILKFEMSMDASATALARGDLSEKSAATYIEKVENEHKLREAMKILDGMYEKR